MKKPIVSVIGCLMSFLLLTISHSPAQVAEAWRPASVQFQSPPLAQAWEQVTSPGDVLEFAVLDQYVFARTANTLYRSEDRGSSWVTLTIRLNTGALNAMDADVGKLYVATRNGVVVSVDYGDTFAWSFYWTWDATMDVDFHNDYGWLVVRQWGSKSGPNRKTPEGQWELRLGDLDRSRKSLFWVVVDPTDPLNVAYVGHDGGPYGPWRYRTLDGGEHWVQCHRRVLFATELNDEPIAIADQSFSIDRGATWQSLGIQAKAVLKYEASERLIVAAQGGGVYVGLPGDWTSCGLAGKTIRALEISEGQLLAASENGDIFRRPLSHLVALAPDRTGDAVPGGTIRYNHVLTNVGTDADTYDLAVSTGWGTLLTSNPVALDPMSTADVQLDVSVPQGAVVGTSQSITLTATSRADPSVTASVVDTTTVVSPYLVYLPYVAQNVRAPLKGDEVYLGQRSSSQCAEHDSYVVPVGTVFESDTMPSGAEITAEYQIRATQPATEVHPSGAPWSVWCEPDWEDCPGLQQSGRATAGCDVGTNDTVTKVFDNVQEQVYLLDGPSDIGTFEVVINGRNYGRHTGVIFGSRWGRADSWNHDAVIYANGFTRWKPKGEAPGAQTDPCFGTSVILGTYQMDVPFLSGGYSPNPLRHPQIETIDITVDGGWTAQMDGAFFAESQRHMNVVWSVERIGIDATEMLVSVAQRATALQDFSLYRILGYPAVGQVAMSSMYADLHKHDADTQIGSGLQIPVGDISSLNEGLWGQENSLHPLSDGESVCLETREPTTHNTGSPTLCVLWGSGEIQVE
jgi:hypothetical protein